MSLNTNEVEKWLDEHGKPNFPYLQSLAKEETLDSLEKLRSIANEHNVSYDNNDNAQVLVDKIVLSLKKENGN